MGFRMMFSGTNLKLDKDLVPILKLPAIDTKQKHAVIHNMHRVLRKSHEDTFPLFFVATGLRNQGEIPYPLNILSEKTVDMMHRCLKEMFDVLQPLDKECYLLWQQEHNFESLFEACLKGEVSVPAAACYAKKFGVEYIDIGISLGLQEEQILNVFNVALRLEKEWDFFKKYHQLVKKSLHNFDV